MREWVTAFARTREVVEREMGARFFDFAALRSELVSLFEDTPI